MSECSRPQVPGGTYFFTLRLQDQSSDLLVAHIALLRDATRLARARWPFVIDAAVVLPNRLHMIWTLPAEDADFSKRWRLIKSTFSRHVPTPAHVTPGRARRGEKGIWQPRFWDHLIRDAADLEMHLHLIRSAPVHAGLVRRASDWPYGSLSRKGVRTIVQAPSVPGQATAVTASRIAPTAGT